MLSPSRLLPLLLLATGSALYGGQIDAIYAFGDSLSDVGNAFLAAGVPNPPYVNHQFTNGNVWVQDLAASLGLPALTPSLAAGNDYAAGSAQSGTTVFNTAGAADLPAQLAAFQTAHPSADPNALYTLWIGSNDVSAIPLTATPTQVQSDLAAITTNIDGAVETLAASGAKNFLIVDVPDLGKTPAALALGSTAAMAESTISGALDYSFLIPSLASIPGAGSLSLKVLDTYSLVDTITLNPSVYGFSDVTDPCLTGSVNYTGGTVCGTPNTFLFWDEIHPTAAADQIVSSAALAVVAPEPSSLALGVFGLLALSLVRLSAQPRDSAQSLRRAHGPQHRHR